MKRFIIAGTGVGPRLAPFIYGQMASDIDADVLALPGSGLGHIDDTVHEMAKRLLYAGDVELVGHSQGGIVAAHLAVLSPRVTKVVAMGAPLGGIRLSPTWAPFASARCMAWDSHYIRRLRTSLSNRLNFPDAYGKPAKWFYTLIGTGDRLVEAESAVLDRAENRVLKDITHTELAWHPRVRQQIKEVFGGGL